MFSEKELLDMNAQYAKELEKNTKQYESEYREWAEREKALEEGGVFPHQTQEEWEREYEEWNTRDRVAREKLPYDVLLLKRFVRRYAGVELDIREHSEYLETLSIPFSEKPFLPDLPAGYVFSGGCARSALERTLHIDVYSEPRDIDIIYMGEDPIDRRVARDLEMRYMPEDSFHGHGISSSSDKRYFSDRDFTINEVSFDGNTLICTKRCLLDTVRGIVRLTEFEKGRSDKLLAKALRFITKKKGNGYEYTFADEEDVHLHGIQPFHMALHLDRAMGEGREYAQKYVDHLKRLGQIQESIQTPEDLYRYFREGDFFCFQYFDDERKEKEQIFDSSEAFQQWESQDPEMPMRESMHKPL